MAQPSSQSDPPPEDRPDVGGFQQPPSDQGLSLEDLTEAFAEMLDSGDDPYGDQSTEPDPQAEASDPIESSGDDSPCPVSPRAILEAILFVGRPDNSPITSREVAALMRGVRPNEIDELIVELNETYQANGCPYSIRSEGPGYRLALSDEYDYLRNQFLGRLREARLSQAAIDVLAIVAYNQPLSSEAVNKLRGRPSGAILSQLVRRQLLRIDRPEKKPRQPLYSTTQRFLDLFGLATVDELPKHHDVDKQ